MRPSTCFIPRPCIYIDGARPHLPFATRGKASRGLVAGSRKSRLRPATLGRSQRLLKISDRALEPLHELDAQHVVTGGEQALAQVRAEKTGAAGDEQLLHREFPHYRRLPTLAVPARMIATPQRRSSPGTRGHASLGGQAHRIAVRRGAAFPNSYPRSGLRTPFPCGHPGAYGLWTSRVARR
jgi:hypothetical protein